MNGLGSLVEQFPLPEISKVLKRTVVSGLIFGAIVLVIAGVLGHVLFGIGTYLGLILGLVNIRAVTTQTARVATTQAPNVFRALASMTIFRLGATTVAVVILFVVSRDLGLGAALGLAAYYLIFVANIVVSILRHKDEG